MDIRILVPFGLTHHGLVNRSAAEQLGISRSAWYRAIDAHHLEQLSKNVARLPGAPSSREQLILGAVWSAGRDAFASHRSCAHLWGAERPDDDPVDIMLPNRSREVTLPGVVVHRPADLRELRPVIRNGIPCARPARMLCDLGAVDDQAVYDTLVHLIVSKVISPRGARAALTRHAQRGHHGITALRAALDRWQLHDRVPDSVLETKMAELLHMHRLPHATFHAVVEGYEVDFLIDGTSIVIECDGWGAHVLDRDQFEFDRVRNAELLAQGYSIVHTTWLQITKSPAALAARIRRVIRRWAPDALGSAA